MMYAVLQLCFCLFCLYWFLVVCTDNKKRAGQIIAIIVQLIIIYLVAVDMRENYKMDRKIAVMNNFYKKCVEIHGESLDNYNAVHIECKQQAIEVNK